MLILTDHPGETTQLLPVALAGQPWSPQTELSRQDQDLWRVLGTDSTPWGLHLDGVGASQFWSRLVLIDEAPQSQFDLLRNQLGESVRQVGPVACVALGGRNFHGHRGRTWSAVRGNLHLSVAFSPEVTAAPHALSITMVPAVAVLDAIAAIGGTAPCPGIKWVNDILIADRKVAGVLTGTQVMGERLELVVLGVGLNVTVAPTVDPTPFVPGVACLQQFTGANPVGLGQVFWALLDALAVRIQALVKEGPSGVFAAYRERSLVIGRHVRIWEEGVTDGRPFGAWPMPVARGLVLDLLPDLTLQIDGYNHPISRGRLALDQACRQVGL